MTILSVLLRSAKTGVEKKAAAGVKVYRGVTTPMNMEGGGPWLKYTFNGNTVFYKPAHNDGMTSLFGMVKDKHELWPLFIFSGVATCFLIVIVWWSFHKMEVQISRGNILSTDWEKAKHYIGRKWTLLDKDNGWRGMGKDMRSARDVEMEKIQDDLAKARRIAEEEKKKHKSAHH